MPPPITSGVECNGNAGRTIPLTNSTQRSSLTKSKRRRALGKKTPHFTPFLPILWQCWVRKVGIMLGHPIALWGP